MEGCVGVYVVTSVLRQGVLIIVFLSWFGIGFAMWNARAISRFGLVGINASATVRVWFIGA